MLSHSRKTWNPFDLMRENFHDSWIYWSPKRELFSDTIGSFLDLSIAEISQFLWKQYVPGDPNLRGHPMTDFHTFSWKFKLTVFCMQGFQDFSKLAWVYEKYRKTLEIAWLFSSNAENALYFATNLAILHFASVFFVNPDQFSKNPENPIWRKVLARIYKKNY